VESAPQLGGLLSTWNIGEYTWDKYYHVILLSDQHLIDTLEVLGLSGQINWGYTKTGFFTDGKLFPMSNLMEFLSFPPLSFLEKLRLGLTILYVSRLKSLEKLEEITSLEWLEKLSGRGTLHKLWEPLLRSKLREYHESTSASFIWSTIARMYAARRSGLKREMFGYVKGGYKTILEHFGTCLTDAGIKTYPELAATKVSQNHNHVIVKTNNGNSLKFDAAILTLPCSKVPELCPQLSPHEKERLGKVSYMGLICASLILRKPLAGFYYTNITDERIPFTGVIEMTALVNRDNFGGNSLVYLPRYMTKDDPFWEKNDAQIQAQFLDALQLMHSSLTKDDLLMFKIARAKEIMPVTTINYSEELLPPVNTSLGNIFLINSAQLVNRAWNANEIIGLAKQKAAELIEFLM
jgi:protoporphyrinogen oxidase